MPISSCGRSRGRSLAPLALGVPLLTLAGLSLSASPAAGQTLVHRFDGSAVEDRAGSAVNGGCDVDLDGFDDILVGVPQSDAGAPDGGAAIVYSGLSGLPLFEFVNTQAGAAFGSAITFVDDLDGDSHPEILVGAPLFDGSGTNCGRAYLYSGASGQLVASFDGV
ncbi:MAG: integrin alpha [Planctomycetota bacterium]